MEVPRKIKILLLQEDNWWVAQWLDCDIAAQAKTMVDAVRELTSTVAGRIKACQKEGIDPFDLPKAPEIYWKLFEKAHDITLREKLDEIPEVPSALLKPTPELRLSA